jgi:hypothetical protein
MQPYLPKTPLISLNMAFLGYEKPLYRRQRINIEHGEESTAQNNPAKA